MADWTEKLKCKASHHECLFCSRLKEDLESISDAEEQEVLLHSATQNHIVTLPVNIKTSTLVGKACAIAAHHGHKAALTSLKIAHEGFPYTPLSGAALANHLELVKFLVEEAKADPNTLNADESTALDLAALSGHYHVFKYLLQAPNVVFDRKDLEGRCLVHYAAAGGNLKIVEEAIAKVTNAALYNSDKGLTPLHALAASYARHTSAGVIACLLEHGVKKDVLAGFWGNSALHDACWSGPTSVVEALIEAGVDRNLLNNQEWSPLFVAAHNGRSGAVKALLKAGVDEKSWTGGEPVLGAAAVNGDAATIEALIAANPASLDGKGKRGNLPLHVAAEHGKVKAIELMLKAKGEQIEALNLDKRTPLHLAAYHGHADAVEALVKHGANLEVRDKSNLTPLILAASADLDAGGTTDGEGAVVARLIKLGANKEATAKPTVGYNENCTALLFACGPVGAAIPLERVRALIEGGSNKEALTNTNSTPLLLVASNKMNGAEALRYLLSVGANKNVKNTGNETLLHRAVIGGIANVNVLLQAGGLDVNAPNMFGRPPLHVAIESSPDVVETIKALAAAGANVNFADTKQLTLLMVAAKGKKTDAIRALIDLGAKKDARDAAGKTAADFATTDADKKQLLAQ